MKFLNIYLTLLQFLCLLLLNSSELLQFRVFVLYIYCTFFFILFQESTNGIAIFLNQKGRFLIQKSNKNDTYLQKFVKRYNFNLSFFTALFGIVQFLKKGVLFSFWLFKKFMLFIYRVKNKSIQQVPEQDNLILWVNKFLPNYCERKKKR